MAEIIEKIEKFIDPIIAKVIDFLQNSNPILIAALLAFAVLLSIIGLLVWLKRSYKLFFLVVILIAGFTLTAMYLF